MTAFLKNQTLLLQQLASGDKKAYAFLIETYHKRLLAYAIRLTEDSMQADDVVQNVYVKLWRKRNAFATVENLNSYLHKSVYYEYIDTYRKQKNTYPLEDIYIETLNDVVEELQDDDHLQKLVKTEIENLPDKIRETFVLSKLEGLSNQEIATYKNISVKTVEAHITKSLKRLRKSLASKLKDFYLLLFM